MKVVILAFAAIMLVGCSSDGTPEHLHRKILKDNEGCVYFARKNVGDTVFLSLVREQSADTCKLKEENEQTPD